MLRSGSVLVPLWSLVYDFFVKYIFGGIGSDGVNYTSYIGPVASYEVRAYQLSLDGGSTYYLSLGSYLSLIATIISMVAIVLICCALIKKIYNMCAHIIG